MSGISDNLRVLQNLFNFRNPAFVELLLASRRGIIFILREVPESPRGRNLLFDYFAFIDSFLELFLKLRFPLFRQINRLFHKPPSGS